MAQPVNKYIIKRRIKHHISVRECHVSCQLLATSSSPLWPVTYGECDALNLLQQTGTGVQAAGEAQRFERKMLLAAVLILIGQRKGWRLSMTEQKARKRISLQESVGLSKTIQTKSVTWDRDCEK